MIRSFLPVLALLFAGSSALVAADEEKKPLDIQALSQRFDAEAKPFMTVEKSTTFIKIDGGVTYLAANMIVPVLEGVMKVNGVFCNKAKPELEEADKVVEKAMKDYKAAASELDELKLKVDEARGKVSSLEDDIATMDKRLAELKKEKNANTQKLSLDLGKKRNELTDAKRDMKKLDKDFDKKKDIPEDLKKKADAMKKLLDDFIANQKKLSSKAENAGADSKKGDDKAGDPLKRP